MEKDIFRPGGLLLTEKYASKMNLSSASSVLDIGCGFGTTLQFLKKKYGCDVCGIDISPAAVEKARLKVPEAMIRIGDAAFLPFDDCSFDAVFMECTLSLFQDPKGALGEAYRVLKDGGYLYVSVITAPGPELIHDGAADPAALLSCLEEAGFSRLLRFDEKHALVQLICDIIFEYGSMEAYLTEAEEKLRGPVLTCGMRKKDVSYGVFTASKKDGA